jgi:hypothetical protein
MVVLMVLCTISQLLVQLLFRSIYSGYVIANLASITIPLWKMLDLQDIGTTPLVPGVFGPTDSR